MVDYINPICIKCDKKSCCSFPCNEYSEYLYQINLEIDKENISQAILKLRHEKNGNLSVKTDSSDYKMICSNNDQNTQNTVVQKRNNPCYVRVSEVDISLQTGVLCALDNLSDLKKGVVNLNDIRCATIPDSYFPKKYCKDDIENYLEYDVGEDTWLKFINRDLPLADLIDENALMDYLEEQNRIYCDQNGLCPECRSPLERDEHKEEVWGSVQTVEVLPMCPNGCV